jgi:CubicO group peptidase (beta-lactamase class C family)
VGIERAQFRVMYRQFLFRMADVEALSAHAQGDSNQLAGRFAALLLAVGLLLSFGALGKPRDVGATRLGFQIGAEHFLIVITMVTVGFFAVLCWDSIFPDRRDVLTLTPLPVRARTLFFAKAAAVATALGLTIAILNAVPGLLWPMNFTAGLRPVAVPSYAFDPPMPPVSAGEMQVALTRDLELPLPGELGLAIGVTRDGARRTWTYGTARRDTLFEIASITKTFTGLLLAQMVDEGRVRLEDPVPGRDFTLLDLATHHAGLSGMPDNARPADPSNPWADYDQAALRRWLQRQRPRPRDERHFSYSNGGFSVLGMELAERSGSTFEDMLRDRITGPLGMPDTVVRLPPEQEPRLAQGWSEGAKVHRWDLDAMAPAGGIHSTVEDMLTYAAAWLGGMGRTALVPRADVAAGRRIGLAWIYDPKTGCYWHDGATAGYTSYLFFCPAGRYAAVVLLNNGPRLAGAPELIGEHIRQRFSGEPALSLRTVTVPGTRGWRGFPRWFAAYWVTMIAAGGFVFCVVLALQGLAAQLLPRRLFLRVSGWLQIGIFCFVLGGAILEPKMPTLGSLVSSEGQRVFVWSPTYWFLGVFHGMNGLTHPALTRLGHAAWTAFAVAAAVAAASYALAYVRTLKQIVEAPEIAPAASGFRWLPRFGAPLATAVAQFSVRTLMRSRQHRLILAFYLGVAFALTVVTLQSPVGGVAPLFLASILTMGFAVAGMRVVFALPLDLRANWMWKVTPVPGGPATLRARRRALMALAVGPVWFASTAACFWTLPWHMALGHTLVLGLLGAVAAELALFGPVKIPFTCSYLPGKSNLHVTFWMCIFGIDALVGTASEFEWKALQHPWGLPAIAVPLLALLLSLRWTKDPIELRFEEEPVDTVVQLRLSGI